MKPDYHPTKMSYSSTMKKQKCFSLVRSPTHVFDCNGRTLLLQIGTLVHRVRDHNEGTVTVKIVDDRKKYNIVEEDLWFCPADDLIPVDPICWPYLEAVPSEVERVALLSQEGFVQQMADLTLDSLVYVVDSSTNVYHKAVVRYIGKIPARGRGRYFGVELLGENDRGDTNGTLGSTSYFQCRQNGGLFCSISRLKPFSPSHSYEESKKGKLSVQHLTAIFDRKIMNKSSSTERVVPNKPTSKWYCEVESNQKNEAGDDCPLAIGDKVVWVTDEVVDCVVHGIDLAKKKVFVTLEQPIDLTRPRLNVDIAELVKAVDFYGHNDTKSRENGDLISWDDDKNSQIAKDLIALNSPPKSVPDGKEYDFVTSSSEGSGYYDLPDPDDSLGVGSMVQVTYHGLPYYGVIRWVGFMENDERRRKMAGIEMEEDKQDFCDGSYGGRRYFSCAPQKGYFYPLSHCQQDSRFMESIPHASIRSSDGYNSSDFGGVESPIVPGRVSPISGEGDITPICGKYKGIQGHHNSCYLDATLFSMFTFTSVFDSLLYRPSGPGDIPHYKEVQRVLRDEIVNPLRKNYYVRADRVMKLRRLMEKLSNVPGLTTEEKDPEEFLTSLVAQILKADPYLKLSSGQEAYHYQLFVEKNEKLVLPTVQQLFEQSFFASNIKLKEVPACLIIQMPRFGKSFKMYPRILPSQLLDVTDVIEDSPRQCNVCGNLAFYECRGCFDQGSPEIGLQNTALCERCVLTVHTHESRRSHQCRKLKVPSEFVALEQHCPARRLYMQLFAVVCIETSHYVTFVKCGLGSDAPWCFFDSMADRKGEQNGYNIPEVVSCPSLPHWLSEQGAVDLQQCKDDRQLPEHAKRLLCDPYMCMYQSIEVMMYR